MWADSSPSLAPYTAAGVGGARPDIANGALLRSGGAGASHEELVGGFTLTPGHAAPPNASATSGGQRWTPPSPEPHAPSPSPPAPRAQGGPPATAAAVAAAASAALDLERGMTSPWQGPSDGVDGKAVGVAPPPGMMEASVGAAPGAVGTATAVLGTGSSGAGLAREQQSGVARQEVVTGGVERSQGVRQQQRQQRQQVAPATAEPVAAQKVSMARVHCAFSPLFLCCSTHGMPFPGSSSTRRRSALHIFHAERLVLCVPPLSPVTTPWHCHVLLSSFLLLGRRRSPVLKK